MDFLYYKEIKSMLQIKNITVTHRKDLRTIIQDFSFSMNPGDKIAIIGEEGNGKSTLLTLIYDAALIENYVEYSGEIIKNGEILGYLSQELSKEEKEKTVYEFFMAYPAFSDCTPKELSHISMQLGLESEIFYEDQLIKTLSGGEKVKLQLARILMLNPSILLLDEPSNDIDIETLEWLENFINTCGIPVLYISHDETLIERTANGIIHIEQLRRKTQVRCTVARIPYAQYISERERNFSNQEQTAKGERREYQKQQERFRKIEQKVEHRQNTISRQDPFGASLLKKKMKTVKSMEKRFEKEYENMTQMPEAEDAIFVKFGEDIRIPNGKTILDLRMDTLRVNACHEDERILARGIKLRVAGAEKICIVGKNGVGKSTLLKEIAALLLAREDIRAAYMPQNYEELLVLTQTPVEFLASLGDKEEITRIRTYLGSMKYTADEMNHVISELSGGQKAKILLLKMSLMQADVLILDEPTRNFSPLSNPVIREVLKSFGGAIISISHDRKYIEEVCDKVYHLTKEGFIDSDKVFERGQKEQGLR